MTDAATYLAIAGFSDPGLKRNHNEDFIGFNQELGIAVLADGMGGHQAGEIAAHMAVNSVLENLQKFANSEKLVSITGSQLLKFVSSTISRSNKLIFQASEMQEAHRGMGTTLVTAMVKDSRVYAGHVGDSRLYLFREGNLTRITKDHSLVQELVDKGFYSEDEARTASVGHVVTRALGTRIDVEVDTVECELQENDILLLCSDGLSDMLSDELIMDSLRSRPTSLETTAKTLIKLANNQGGRDNISVILMELKSRADTKNIDELGDA